MKKREVWLDVLRILAAFLVIVNHTNSDVFQSITPANGTWWLSIVWYALCKVAVPLFVMVSGAVLLGREDSYGKCLARFGRIAAALLVFSYAYFAHDAWVNYGLWPRIIQLDVFLHKVWTLEIADSFWYLYFYAGLMLALPLLQRLSCAMKSRDAWYLIGLSLGLGAGWPLIAHFVPALAMPKYFDVPLFTTMIGLFFAGWQLRRLEKPLHAMPWLMGLIASVLLSVVLVHAEYMRMEGAGKYWAFMDDRMQSSLLVVTGAISLFLLVRCLFDRPMSERAQRVWMELGSCAFGIYLMQQWVIEQLEFRLFMPLCHVITAFPAVLVWEIAAFAISLMTAMVLRRIPGIKKIV